MENKENNSSKIDIDKNDFKPIDSKYYFLDEEKFKIIGKFTGSFLYKYMNLEAALLSLKYSSLRFVEPIQWDDLYEGRFYNAKYINIDEGKTAPFLYACCFSSKNENEAAWVLYPHNKTGLASRCVQFRLNRLKLWKQLVSSNTLKNPKYSYSIYVGKVNYQRKYIIDNLHLPCFDNINDNIYFNEYFKQFTLDKYLNLLLLKRNLFEHEKEVRIFIVPDKESGKKLKKTIRGENGKFPPNIIPKYIDVKLDWVDIIENIKIDKNCTDYEVSLLKDALTEKIKEKMGYKKTSDEYYTNKFRIISKIKRFDPYKDESQKKGSLKIEIPNK